MLYGAQGGGLEIRQGGDGTRVIAGRFPYSAATDLAPGRREVIEARAFAARLDAGEDIHLLLSHDFAKPLASRAAGSRTVEDGDEALTFEARIAPAIAETSHGRDALAMIGAGLAAGLSPGFRVPDGGATVAEDGAAVLRRITRADLFELSIVTRPAYGAAQVEARNWQPMPARQVRRAYAWR